MAKDFTKKTFAKILRGYAPEEVDGYIAYINEEYRKLERRNAENERKLALALKKLDEAHRAADPAAADNAANNAAESPEAAAVLREAAEKAERILAAANDEAAKIRSDALAKAKLEADGVHKAASLMYGEVCSFRDSLFELYNEHIESIENMTESAKAYVDRADKAYTGATGVAISRDDDADDVTDDTETETEPTAYDDDGDVPAFDEDDEIDDTIVEIDVTDEKPAVRDVYIDLLEDEDEDDVLSFDDADGDEDILRIDWKNRRAAAADDDDDDTDDGETRVLDLRAIREAVLRGDDTHADDDIPDGITDGAGDSDFDESGDASVVKEFGDLDFLFSKEKLGNDGSGADEFDIVFANSDVNRDIDEIRRQPTIVPNEPKNKKKHSKHF